ncbi:MAG TPA: TolC family protein, partial [Acidiphilium sp.]|nr:TolC family protein [Acidiphilium sp.]
MRLPRLAAAALLPLGLAGCAVGPAFHPPKTRVPARFAAAAAAAAAASPAWPKPGWWRHFGSPELDRLVTAAKAHNFSVIEAIDQLEAANAQAQIAGAPLLPTITASGSGSFQQAQASTAGGLRTVDTRSFTATFQASYQLDFWGRNYDALHAAQANAAAAEFNAATVALTAEASVATVYFQVLADQDQLG